MNFKKNSIALASLLALTALVGCGKDKGPATVEGMKINGIVTAYMENETIDWSALTVTATYSDKSTTTFANSEIEFDVETPAESTKLVVFTSGLHAQTAPLTEGEYDVTAALKADLSKKYSLGSISVGTITPAKYKLRTFDLPEFANSYNQTIRNAGTASEGAFKKADELFTVGTLNTFKFAPVATFTKIGASTLQPYVSDNYAKTVSLKVVNGTNKSDAPTDSYEVVKGGIKFKDSAAGNSYELTMSPEGFKIGEETPEVKFSFKVERGLNIYSAKELGALNLTHYTETDFDTEGTTFEEHKGNTRDNSASNVFFNAETGYYRPNYKQIWKNFLTGSTFSEAEITAYEDVPAIFFQNNIVLTSEDVPAEYFITEAESVMFTGSPSRAGSFRDDACLYVPIVHDNDVVVNGNYFSFDAQQISLCNSTTAVPGMDFYVFPENYTGQVPPGHATVFKFCGIDPIDSDQYRKSQVDSANGHKGVVKNVNAVGNTSVVDVAQNDKIMEVTGLIFAKNTECGGQYYNNNIKQFQIGIFPDCNNGQPYQTAQVNRTFIDQCKVFDCSNTGICNYHNGGALVTHSEFNRFGGAPILNAGCTDAWAYGITTIGEDVQLKNEITGGEVYFNAVGASGFFALISGWEQFFNNVGNTFVIDGKMDLIALNMDGQDYVASPNHAYYGDVYLNTYEGSQNPIRCSIDPTFALPEWQVYEGVHSIMGKYPPVFKTEKGEIFFTDNENALFYLDGAEVKPVNWQLQGEYLSILLPVEDGTTTLNAVFRLSKLSA